MAPDQADTAAWQGWKPAPEAPSLDGDEIQIWRVALERRAPEVTALEQCLAADEQVRADRFRFARDRRRYVVTRGVLRTLLGRMLDVAPTEIRLQYGPEGKPSLSPAHGNVAKALQFNVAHSREVALLALAWETALGVDVEYIRELSDAEQIARRFFSAQEVASFLATPAEQRRTAFFRIWTRKEAFIKATGKGLSQPLGAFNVMTRGGHGLQYVQLDGRQTRWRLWDLPAGAEYGAALAVWAQKESFRLRRYRYD